MKDTDTQDIAKELYQRNLDLFVVNRELSLLTRLYSILTSTLNNKNLAKEYIKAIVKDLNLYAGQVFYHEHGSSSLVLLAGSESLMSDKINAHLKRAKAELKIPLKEKDNKLVEAYYKQGRTSSHYLHALLKSQYFGNEDLNQIQEESGVRAALVIPIIFGKESLGVIAIYLNNELSSITKAERNTLSSVAGLFGVALDRLRIFTDLQKANENLRIMDKRKDEFLSMAAHELRAPLTAIKGYVSMILEGDTGEVSPKAREFLADTTVINERLIRLVNNMLNVSRIEENRMVYQIEEENMSRIAQMVFSVFKLEAERKGLGYKLEIPHDLRDRVQVDSDKLQEVIGNLVSNAIKYTETGSITIRLSQVPEAVRLEVVDTGPGISKEEQAKLFQKFYRVESAVGKTTGTGLGLYISKLIVEKFGGRIGIESDSDKGSNFWIEIPLFKVNTGS